MVSIFSSHDAARQSIFRQEYTKRDLETFAHMHARYLFDADRHEEYVEIMPVGVAPSLRTGPYSTRIDLPIAAAPHCRLELNKRCLIEMEDVDYPDEALKRNASGKVTLSGTITPSGKVDHVRVVKAELNSEEHKTLLTTSAIHTLSSWRLEAGPHHAAIQITFSYAIDYSLPNTDRTQVRWALPNEVAIRGKLPE